MLARRPGRRAERFGIGVATAIYGFVGRARASGALASRASRNVRSLTSTVSSLLALIEAEPDITIAEMQERLRSEAGIAASVGTVWTFLDRAGLTFKKRPPTRPSRSARTS